ncbi:MAG: hypothetical protein ACD_32C00014G0006 [uncultured bacterium]|uniref:Glycosyl transferase group 1 n=1 Tax=Candidatus Daviesbacteria bacterium GW2011_GWC2_40_12 TaxID=1618431 RepID=A0A0G0T6E9_9BACT|nr:MAG: hypothetical protein ACD_32C00014G0006 [uncultured bacterium]KKQ83994.1 MAG: Glycosyl transferase group 1 [Candidatus Daviesbacteria bacterium GW2011_GWF2_38_7]KKR17301.1 MAG: Glycosyl transferase group 1 [Candidatus Daviesbacteria bacterium GW2011_GWA2_39_33]KKR42700.1 MAG: Glycosyl transferase group 1 [Candidatus Daviesbacteria bacterium GW2011_GWC2_40_12]OGE21374.1 MAG: hypothetical protein A2778_04370 [Candidatus Daviesbacteria bacterium RIFCSPHIGHO2_01_FULL_40_24]OGE30109.1 MAG: h
MKKAGVYDRWLYVLGGGEQVAFAYAEALRDLGYQTDLITHRKVDIEAAKAKMDLNLKGINLKYIPNMVDSQLGQHTEQYDIFVSNSYLDYIPNRSKYGILSVFFPSRINISLYEYLKRAHIVPSLKNFFIYPSRFEGFRYDECVKGTIYKWLDKESVITFNKHIGRFKIELFFDYLFFSCIDGITFLLNGSPIKPKGRTLNIFENTAVYSFEIPKKTKGFNLTIKLPEGNTCAVAVIGILIPNYRYFLYNLFKTFFPRLEMRLHGGPSMTRFSDIETYNKVITISEFSRYWVKRYWGLSSEVLYPPASINKFQPSKNKKNIIVNIGRFFVTGHCKKQLDMVRVFKKLADKGFSDWELHFIGSVAEGEAHQRYFRTVQEESQGYPVFFHINIPFNQLKEILSVAKIYWHATGLDEDSNRTPIRMEHFGITTVEAMASGCVPVVINKGGQSEIVTEDSGFLWNSRDELLEFTIKLIKNSSLLRKKSQGALERSKFFSKENFKGELQKYLPKD